MKILGVKFKNINSLMGEWEIRFDRSPLSDARLFAIVGPNGSGKSSILDALTLALYGETPRLRNPESEILSWQADDSYSEVTFSVGEQLYRSRWSVRKVKGRLQTPEMSLASLSGRKTIMEDRVVKVRDRVAHLTGLDFKRFCCSVLLAQGEFTAFLNALENERAEILERIIGSEIAQELEESIRNRAAVEGERLLRLKESAENFPPPDKARINQIRQSYENTQEQIRETDRILEELRTHEAWLERLERLESAQLNAEETLAVVKPRYDKAQADFRALERARLAKPLEEAFNRVESLEADAATARSQLSRVEEDVPAAEARINELEERIQENDTVLKQLRKQLEDRSDDFTNASLRDREIAAENDHFLEVVSKYEAIERSQKEAVQEQAEIERRIADIESRSQDLQSWLQEHRADGELQIEIPSIDAALPRLAAIREQFGAYQAQKAGATEAERHTARQLERAERAAQKVRRKVDGLAMRKAEREASLSKLLGNGSSESLVADLSALKKKLAACKELVEIGRRYRKLAGNGDIQAALARVTSERDSLAQTLAREQTALAALEEQARWRDTVTKYNPDRSALKSGTPCPLCGALDHPYVEKGPPDFAELDRALRAAEKKVRALGKDLEALDNRAAELHTLTESAESVQREWETISAQAGGQWTIGDVDVVEDTVRSLKGEIKGIKSRIRRARWQTWRVNWVDRSLQNKMHKLSRKEQTRDGARSNHTVQQAALADINSEMQRLEEEERTIRLDLSARLERFGIHLPESGREMELLQRVRRQSEIYQMRREERGTLDKELQSLKSRREALLHELQQLPEQAAALAAETQSTQARLYALKAEREALYGTMDPIGERQTLESEIELRAAEEAAWNDEIGALRQRLMEDRNTLLQLPDRVREARAAFEEAERNLLEQAAGLGFASIGEIGNLLLVLQEEEEIVLQHAAAEQSLAEAESEAAAARNALESARSERQTDDSLEMVRSKIDERTKHRDALEQTINDLERSMREHSELEGEYREILQAISSQEKIHDQAVAELKTVQSQDAAKTRRELQRVMLERLVEQTNKHLAMLGGRYSLQLSADDGFGIQVEDALQGKTHRSFNTLSGGESFVVSLCLALGLADMAGKHRKIESLFLDEGFGGLDEEMLYMALSTLKGLRDNGKMVGVVSHVKRLADEIPTQIRVEKTPKGLSRITVVA